MSKRNAVTNFYQATGGYVYCFTSACGGYVKIGHSDAPGDRAKQIGLDSINLVDSSAYRVPPPMDVAWVESVLHAALADWRVNPEVANSCGLPSDGRSEWFQSGCKNAFLRVAAALRLHKDQKALLRDAFLDVHPDQFAQLSELLGGQTRARLLLVLCYSPNREFSLAELAELSQGLTGNTHRYLKRWVTLGLVIRDNNKGAPRYSIALDSFREAMLILLPEK